MGIVKKVFGTDKKTKKAVYEYSIKNKNGMCAKILNYGGIIRELWVPDARGKLTDVVLGHDDLMPYYENEGFLGAAIGPSANRIGGAKFTIDGVEYQVPVNENENNLHSDEEQGYHVRIFDVEEGENSIKLSLQDEDGCMGFPGNKKFELVYTVTEENELRLDYHFVSDKRTILNPTNHSYFNLKGQDGGSIEDHVLWLRASHYTPVAAGSIPTGEIAPVKGTPMDFTEPKRIGQEIGACFEQIELGGGYDHNWVLDDADGQLGLAAKVTAPGTSLAMKVYTTLPGIQFYAGNFLGDQEGKLGAAYHNRCGFALETQYFPDSIHRDNFPDAVFGPDRQYVSSTVYQFCNE